MMDNHPFFKNVWRLNGLLIAFVGVTGVLGTLLSVLLMVDTMIPDQDPQPETSLTFADFPPPTDSDHEEEVSEEKAPWTLSEMRPIPGYAVQLMTKYSPQYGRLHAYEAGSHVRNILFFNTESHQTTWLLNDEKYAIKNYEVLEKDNRATAILYSLEPLPVTETAGWTLALSEPDGSALTPVLEGVTQVIDHQAIQNGMRLMILKKGHIHYTAVLDVANKALTHFEPVPDQGSFPSTLPTLSSSLQ